MNTRTGLLVGVFFCSKKMSNKFKSLLVTMLSVMLCLALCFVMTACDEEINVEKTGTVGKVDTYTVTIGDDFSYSFTITNGEDGQDGKDGVSITGAEINDNHELIINLSQGDPINLGNVKGADGVNGVGISDIAIDANGQLVVTLTEGDPINLGSVKGETGVGVAKVEVGADGHLYITYTNSENAIDVGSVKGANGISVTGVAINDSNELVISFSEGEDVNLGNIKGATGVGVAKVEVGADGHLYITYTNSDSAIDVGSVKGANGISVTGVAINDSNELVISFSEGEDVNLGNIKGATGVGVAKVEVGADGHLYITYTNSDSAIDVGSVKGANGISVTGVVINDSNELVISFSEGEDVNLGNIKGAAGVGVAKVEVGADGHLYITYTNSENAIDVGSVKGANGISVTGVSINDSNELVISFSEGEPVNLGNIKGATGVGVAKVEVGADGHLYITYTNSETAIDVGNIKGESGSNGTSVEKVEVKEDGYLYITLTGSDEQKIGKVQGTAGSNGLSAYELWIAQSGNENKTVDDFYAYLKGEQGVGVSYVTSSVDQWGIKVTLTLHLTNEKETETSYIVIDPLRNYLATTIEEVLQLEEYGVKEGHIVWTDGRLVYLVNTMSELEAAVTVTNSRVIVMDDISMTARLVVRRVDTLIDLNGKTLDYNGPSGMVSAIWALGSAAKLTIEDNSAEQSGLVNGNDMAAVTISDDAQLVINSGSYCSTPSPAVYIYYQVYPNNTEAKVGGTATINGGTFESKLTYSNRYWVLNMRNGATGGFEVKGGTFINFNPATPNTDDKATYLASGYVVVEKTVDDHVEYEVVAAKDLAAAIDDVENQIIHVSDNAGFVAAVAINNANIVLDHDFELLQRTSIFTTITVDLNGKSIDYQGTNSFAALWVRSKNGSLTLNDSSDGKGWIYGNIGSTIVVSENASLVVNGGNYTSNAQNEDGSIGYPCVYIYWQVNDDTKAGGNVTINGGTFETTVTYRNIYWTLNMRNGATGGFEVKGGTFINFNPAAPNTDDKATYLADGYVTVAKTVDDHVEYTVVANEDVAEYVANNSDIIIHVSNEAGLTAALSTENDVVVVLDHDFEIADTITVLSNATVNMNGKTLTVTSEATALTAKDETVTLTIND